MLPLVGGIQAGIVFLIAGSRLGPDAGQVAFASALSVGVGVAHVLVARLLRRPDRLAWWLAVGLVSVVVVIALLDGSALLRLGAAASLWGPAVRALLALVTFVGLVAASPWYGVRT